MNGKAIAGIIAVLIVAGGLWWYFSGADVPETTQEETLSGATTTPSGSTSTNPQSKNITVTYTNDGFSPATVTVPVGATVTFVNQSSGGMWVGADEHPTHMNYDGTSRSAHCAASYTGPTPFDECKNEAKGATYSFTFTKAGTHDYHNHVQASHEGTVVVTSGTSVNGSVNVEL